MGAGAQRIPSFQSAVQLLRSQVIEYKLVSGTVLFAHYEQVISAAWELGSFVPQLGKILDRIAKSLERPLALTIEEFAE